MMKKCLLTVFLITLLLSSLFPPFFLVYGAFFGNKTTVKPNLWMSEENWSFLGPKSHSTVAYQSLSNTEALPNVSEEEISQEIHDVLWTKIFGNNSSGTHSFEDLAKTPDGDIIVVGTIYNSASMIDFWILCVDKRGNVKWQRTYNGGSYGGVKAVTVAPNGDIIVVGDVPGVDGDEGDILVLQLDKEGDKKWQKIYNFSEWGDFATAVVVNPQGDIIVVGESDNNLLVFQLDDEGNVKWQKIYGFSDLDSASGVAISSNGDIIVVGESYNYSEDESDMKILGLDENGNVKWQKTYGGKNWDGAYKVVLAPNGDLIIAGYYGGHWKYIDNEGRYELIADLWLLRLDENGNVKWQKTYGGEEWEAVYAVISAFNGDVFVATSTTHNHVLLCQFNGEGELEWKRDYGEYGMPKGVTLVDGTLILVGTSPDATFSWIMGILYNSEEQTLGRVSTGATDVAVTFEGDIIVVGWIEKNTTNGKDMWILSLSSDGSENWERTFGFEGDETATAVVTSPDGGIFVTGNFTIRLDKHGNLVWISSQRGVDISLDGGGNLIVLSPSYQQFEFDKMSSRFEIVKMDSRGRLLWKREFFDEKNAIRVSKMAVTPGGDIVVVGSSAARIGYSYSVVLYFDQNGNLKWRLAHTGGGFFNGDSAVAFFRALGIVTGGTTFYSTSEGVKRDIVLSVINTSGILSWSGEYENGGVNRDNAVSDILVLPLGYVLILGYTFGGVIDNVTSWLWVMDKNKEIFWKRNFPGFAVEAGALLPNGDLIVVGNKKPSVMRDEWNEAVIRRIRLGNGLTPLTQKVRFRGVVAGVDACAPITPYCLGGDWIINITEMIIGNFTWTSPQIFVHLDYSSYNPYVKVDNVSEGDLVEVYGTLVMNPWPHVELMEKGDYLRKLTKVTIDEIKFKLLNPLNEHGVNSVSVSQGQAVFELQVKSSESGTLYGYISIVFPPSPNNVVERIPFNLSLEKGMLVVKDITWDFPSGVLPGTYVAIVHLYSDSNLETYLVGASIAFYINDPTKNYVEVMVNPETNFKVIHVHLQKLPIKNMAVTYPELIKIFELDKIPVAEAIVRRLFLEIPEAKNPTDITFMTLLNWSGDVYLGHIYETYPLDIPRKILFGVLTNFFEEILLKPVEDALMPLLLLREFYDLILNVIHTFAWIPKDVYENLPDQDAYYEISSPKNVTTLIITRSCHADFLGRKEYSVKLEFFDPNVGTTLNSAGIKVKLQKGILEFDPEHITVSGPLNNGQYIVKIQAPPLYDSFDSILIFGYGPGWFSERFVDASFEKCVLVRTLHHGGYSSFMKFKVPT